VSGHTHFNRTCPFGHHAFQSHLEKFVGTKRSSCQHHTIIEIIGSAAKTLEKMINYILQNTLSIKEKIKEALNFFFVC